MKLSKIFLFAYPVFAVYFGYVAISKYNAGIIDYPAILLCVTAIFVFFFRRKFIKKFENRDNSN